ncbi:MAG TPA: hypothetical protein VMU82_10665 [Acetobacteraceae bacterium]|nr:hypothetical protein [Acetobacteraceae bacterium]
MSGLDSAERDVFADSDLAPYLAQDGLARVPPASPAKAAATDKPPAVEVTEIGFDEDAYLQAHADVAASIGRGDFTSAYHHYTMHGRAEGRTRAEAYRELLRAKIMVPARPMLGAAGACAPWSVEALVLSPAGALFVVGWADDSRDPIDAISIFAGEHSVRLGAASLARSRRRDAEESLGAETSHSFGFWTFAVLSPKIDLCGPCTLVISFASGAHGRIDISGRRVGDSELRNLVMGYFANLDYFGSKATEGLAALDGFIGGQVIRHNLAICQRIARGASVERFGPRRSRFAGSIIVCLYGRHEYFFLQTALFAAPGWEEYEFIYVSNSPELAELLRNLARIAEQMTDLSISLVTLPGNAGFGAANNVAAGFARSDRLMIVNPDVFPMDQAWPARHAALVAEKPPEQTRLFGAPLFYDDGSLMHGGMYFDLDVGLSVAPDGIVRRPLVRVEHYDKGAPAWAEAYAKPRPVPAITGAFMSIDRDWFEQIGGFTEEYVFGHYEDADLCLKSLRRGVTPWLQDIRFWHLEGKGSTRLPYHEGGSTVNRWRFTRAWGGLIADRLCGRAAAIEDFTMPAPPPPSPIVVTIPSAAAEAPSLVPLDRKTPRRKPAALPSARPSGKHLAARPVRAR